MKPPSVNKPKLFVIKNVTRSINKQTLPCTIERYSRLEMGKEKIKIQLVDADGDKVNLALDGWSKTTKIAKILDALKSSLETNEKDPHPRNNTS